MKKKMRIYLAGAFVCAATLFAVVACDDKENQAPAPDTAGAITATGGEDVTGGVANKCPSAGVTLSVDKVKNAASYQWYKDGEKIDGAVAADYAATASGAYTVAGVNSEGEAGKPSPALVVTITVCTTQGVLPAAAGTITAPGMNDCPTYAVTLSVASIEGATSYSWKATYAPGDSDSTLTAAPTYTDDFASLDNGQPVTYTVSGVNAAGYGPASAPKVVTKQHCDVPAPVITITPGAGIAKDDDASAAAGYDVYTTTCPTRTITATASCDMPGVTYEWYRQRVGTDAELRTYSATDPVATLGAPGYTYTYAVVAIKGEERGKKSNLIQVIGGPCNIPYWMAGAVSLYVEGFMPQEGESLNKTVSNCDVQAATGQPTAAVTLVVNKAITALQEVTGYPVLGYKFYVKTTPEGEYALEATTTGGINSNTLAIGTTHPAGTYMVKAYSGADDSEFGNNWVAVEIDPDCAPTDPTPALTAPTFSALYDDSGIITDGVITNTCTGDYKDIVSIKAEVPTGSTAITWSKLDDQGVPITPPERVNSSPNWTSRTPAHNGTYSVTYEKDGQPSPAGTIVIDVKLCKPTFYTDNTEPIEIPASPGYAVVVLNEIYETVKSLVTYKWYRGTELMDPQPVKDNNSDFRFRLTEPGVYKVKATSQYGESEFSDEIELAAPAPLPDVTYTRANLVGTYTVADYSGTGASLGYKLDITEGANEGEIIIYGLGGSWGTNEFNAWYATLNATVTFRNGKDDNNYGTITIEKQVFQGTVNYNADWTFSRGAPNSCPPPEKLELTIKYVNGGPGVSQTGVQYGMWSGTVDSCKSQAAYFRGSATNVTTWTKDTE